MVALGMGLTMVGATIMGASASLADLPAPFVKNGQANVNIVVGANALTEDVIGAADVAAMVASELAEQTAVELRGRASGDDNRIPVRSGSQEILPFESIVDAGEDRLDESDSALLADTYYRDDSDGSSADLEINIYIGNATTVFDQDMDQSDLNAIEASGGTVRGGSNVASSNLDLDKPQLYLDTANIVTRTATGDNLFVIDLSTTGSDVLNLLDADDAEVLPFPLGQEFRVQNIGDSDDRIVLQTGVELTLRTGQDNVVTLLGEEHTVEVGQGGESGTQFVAIVDGESAIIDAGEREYYRNDVSLYCWDILVVNQAEDVIANCLFAPTGEGELRLEVADDLTTSFTQVEDGNGDNVDGLEVSIISTGGAENITSIAFGFNTDDLNVDAIPWGSVAKMPGFAAWFEFGEPTPTIDDGDGRFVSFSPRDRAPLKLKTSGDDVRLEFANGDGEMCELDWLTALNATHLIPHEDYTHGSANVTEDQYFFWTEDATDNEPLTMVYEVTDVDTDEGTVDLREHCAGDFVASGKTITLDAGDDLGDGTVVTIHSSGDVELSEAPSTTFYTRFGAEVSPAGFPAVGANTASAVTVTVTEDWNDAIYTEDGNLDWDFNINADGTDTNAVFSNPVDGSNGIVHCDSDESGNTDFCLSQSSIFEIDGEDGEKFEAQIGSDNTLLPFWVNLGMLGGSSSSGSNTAVDRVDVGLSVLDSEVSGWTNNLIVVGGPCANTVAADLLGNPADCTEGFEPGKATIHLFDQADTNLVANGGGYVALLVAGYSAADTRRATGVLANFRAYDLDGTQVELTARTDGSVMVSEVSAMAMMPESDSEDQA